LKKNWKAEMLEMLRLKRKEEIGGLLNLEIIREAERHLEPEYS